LIPRAVPAKECIHVNIPGYREGVVDAVIASAPTRVGIEEHSQPFPRLKERSVWESELKRQVASVVV